MKIKKIISKIKNIFERIKGERLMEPKHKNTIKDSSIEYFNKRKVNGYCKLYFDFLEILSELNLNGIEIKILLYLYTECCKWNKKSMYYDYDNIKDIFSISKNTFYRVFNKLEQMKVIELENKKTKKRGILSFNFDCDTWKTGNTEKENTINNETNETNETKQPHTIEIPDTPDAPNKTDYQGDEIETLLETLKPEIKDNIKGKNITDIEEIKDEIELFSLIETL